MPGLPVMWHQSLIAKSAMEIYSLEGKRIKTLMSNKPHASGVYTIQWDDTTNNGGSAEAGVYFFRFRSGSRVQTARIPSRDLFLGGVKA